MWATKYKDGEALEVVNQIVDAMRTEICHFDQEQEVAIDWKGICDDLQIDAHSFAPFRDLALVCLTPLSANLSSDELILVNGLRGSGSVEQERPVFDFERYREVGALGDGVLEVAMSDETPGAGL